jgi:pyruvate,water dikinase
MILLAIAGQLKSTDSPAQRAREAQAAAQEDLRKMNPVGSGIWQRVLHWSHHLIAMREDFKSNMSLAQAIYGLAARRLAQKYHPDMSEDTGFLYTWAELKELVESKGQKLLSTATLQQRHAELELHRTQLPPPELIWYTPETRRWRNIGEEAAAVIPEGPRSKLQGIPASAGRGPVEGIAVVTNDPIEAARRLLETTGPAILITRLTDPAWSSLFARLTAVVTELGGVISHAAIVARENGLPAVVGVADATRLIQNGQRLRLDGMTGTIEILD